METDPKLLRDPWYEKDWKYGSSSSIASSCNTDRIGIGLRRGYEGVGMGIKGYSMGIGTGLGVWLRKNWNGIMKRLGMG